MDTVRATSDSRGCADAATTGTTAAGEAGWGVEVATIRGIAVGCDEPLLTPKFGRSREGAAWRSIGRLSDAAMRGGRAADLATGRKRISICIVSRSDSSNSTI